MTTHDQALIQWARRNNYGLDDARSDPNSDQWDAGFDNEMGQIHADDCPYVARFDFGEYKRGDRVDHATALAQARAEEPGKVTDPEMIITLFLTVLLTLACGTPFFFLARYIIEH